MHMNSNIKITLFSRESDTNTHITANMLSYYYLKLLTKHAYLKGLAVKDFRVMRKHSGSVRIERDQPFKQISNNRL